MRIIHLVFILSLLSARPLRGATNLNWELLTTSSKSADCVTIAANNCIAAIVVDNKDFPVVSLAANFFADDVRRVTGHRATVADTTAGAPQLIIVGTLGHSKFIDSLAANGKLKNLDQIKGRWEATLWQIVEKPFPDVECALVIAGSDRRGAAYGLMRLSEKIGVSPWYWWADVPAKHHDALTIKFSSPQVRWPWGETTPARLYGNSNQPPANQLWRDAADADSQTSRPNGHWEVVEGLGPSGRAVSLQPPNLSACWKEDDSTAPTLNFKFKSAAAGDSMAFVDFLPTFRICPGMKLRVAVSVDDQQATLIEVPGSSGAENETGTIRSSSVQNNFTRAQVPLPGMTAGKHTFKIRAIDPGVVIDRVSLP